MGIYLHQAGEATQGRRWKRSAEKYGPIASLDVKNVSIPGGPDISEKDNHGLL